MGGFLVSQKEAVVMITILQGWRTSPSMSSGKGWHLVSLVMLQILGCASLYQAVPSPFPQIRSLNTSELSLSALFPILSPLKNFSLLFWASENVTASMLLLCYYTGNEIYSRKSLNPKGNIHLYESTQLERKTRGSISLL